DRVTVDSLASDAIEALGNVQALDLELCVAAGSDFQCAPANAKAVGRKFVAVRRDAEPHLRVHQSGLVESDEAIRIGVITDAARRLQFDHRHAAAGLPVD